MEPEEMIEEGWSAVYKLEAEVGHKSIMRASEAIRYYNCVRDEYHKYYKEIGGADFPEDLREKCRELRGLVQVMLIRFKR